MVHRTADLKAWLDAGLAAHHRGEIDRAVSLYRQVLDLSPGYSPALKLLGAGLLQLGRAADALLYLEQVPRKDRRDPGLLANLAHAHLALGRPDDAGAAFREASRLAPKEPQFQVGLAAALAMAGKLAEAEPLLRRLSAKYPAAPLVWFNLGNVLRDRAQPLDAIAAYQRALSLEPGFVEARNSLGSVLHSLQRFAEAERHYRDCLAADPGHRAARYNLASVLIDLGRFAEGEVLCRALVAAEPDEPNAHAFLSSAVGHQGRLLEALRCQAAAARLSPGDSRAAAIYGTTLSETGHPAAGFRWLADAADASGAGDGVRQLMSTAFLAQGCLHDGWREYGRQPAALRFREKYPGLHLATSLPADVNGRPVCVLREQGLGDEIFLLRYASDLAARGARVAYRASAKIASLLARLPFVISVLPESGDLPPADAYILVGDLPAALHELPSSPLPARRTPRTAVVRDWPYHVSVFWPAPPASVAIAPLGERVAHVRAQLRALGPPPYIGVTWRGGTPPEEQSSAGWMLFKEVPLEALGRSLSGAPGTFLALQRKPVPGEIDRFAGALGRPLHDLSAMNEDLEAMHALLSEIDEYVGVSNTNMHLRAAAGKTGRVLVPAPAEWRWMRGTRESVWFPGFGVYRQSLNGGWATALESLERDLVGSSQSDLPA